MDQAVVTLHVKTCTICRKNCGNREDLVRHMNKTHPGIKYSFASPSSKSEKTTEQPVVEQPIATYPPRSISGDSRLSPNPSPRGTKEVSVTSTEKGEDRGEEEEIDPQKALHIYPSHENVYVDILVKSFNPGTPDEYMGSLRTSNFLVFDNEIFAGKCDIDCTVFIVPNETHVSDDDLSDGVFSRHHTADSSIGPRADKALILKREIIHKYKDDTIEPTFIDSGADMVDFAFVKDDTNVESGCTLKGTFAAEDCGEFEFESVTCSVGTCLVALPAGSLSAALHSPTGEVLKSKSNRPIGVNHVKPRRKKIISPIHIPPHPTPIDVIVDSTILSNFRWMTPDRPVVVLGDISGSMGSEMRMQNLKDTFKVAFERAIHLGAKIALVAWDSWTEYFSATVFGGGVVAYTYLTEDDRSQVMSWVESRSSRGGNNMRYAIEDAIRNYPDAKDVVVMCDGDTRPFVTDDGDAIRPGQFEPKPSSYSNEAQGRYNWGIFRACYPQVTFHFVSFSRGASHAVMETMASQSGGSYTVANQY